MMSTVVHLGRSRPRVGPVRRCGERRGVFRQGQESEDLWTPMGTSRTFIRVLVLVHSPSPTREPTYYLKHTSCTPQRLPLSPPSLVRNTLSRHQETPPRGPGTDTKEATRTGRPVSQYNLP